MSNVQACYCPVCKMEAHSIAGTKHRRCGGKEGAPPRKHQPRAEKRGVWQPGSAP